MQRAVVWKYVTKMVAGGATGAVAVWTTDPGAAGRAAAGRAMARAREILDTLQQQGVRMPLTDQRLKDIAQ